MPAERWMLYAGLSAVCAAMVAILGKAGLKSVDPTLATVLRSIVMTVFLLIVGTALGVWAKLPSLYMAGSGGGAGEPNSGAWFGVGGKAMAIIALSGVAGAVSWLFYFKALQLADASKVAPIDKLSVPIAIVLAVVLLGERPSGINWLGIGLIVVGAYLAAMPAR
mgnify:CR=1 FL=1